MNNEKIELPVVTETDTDSRHVSLLLIADGLKQADVNLSEQEANIRKLSEQLQQLQSMRIASIAQKNLLQDLQARIVELENVNK